MTADLAEVKRLQKAIVQCLERGEDSTALLQELSEVRAEIARGIEREELSKVAERRKELRERAEAVKARVERQGAAIDAFLQARDELVRQLEPCFEPLRELARMGAGPWDREPGECYRYADAMQFLGALRDIPAELLPEDFSCPTLQMTQPGELSIGKVNEALFYLQSCMGILASFQKGAMPSRSEPAADSLLLDGADKGSREIPLVCRVCDHVDVKAINTALQDGRSLRDIESEFSISRSTLSRHRNRCLNLGAVRMRE